MFAVVSALGTAVPEHRAAQRDVKAAVRRLFASGGAGIERLLAVFDNSGIAERRFCMPLSWYNDAHPPEEKHRLFVEHAAALAEEAARRCLAQRGLAPEAVDHLMLVTSTGIAAPSIDAHLFNRLGCRPDVARSPLWGLGCAGGAAGLARAAEYATAFPERRCLLVAVELCSLTFLRGDASNSNIVATSLFADGAAAALVEGAEAAGVLPNAGARPAVVAARSRTWRDSLDVMGWNMRNDGMQVVFSKHIPSLVLREMPGVVAEFLASCAASAGDVAHYALHPGGRKVLEAYESALGLHPAQLSAAREVLAQFGNMSSCTVLFVLERLLRSPHPPLRGERILAGALGPGFSAELLLLDMI